MLTLKPIHTKRFGQHFLHDKNYIKRIIGAAGIQPTDCFIEIGPGGGALTEHLLPLVSQLIAIEIDPVLCADLEAQFSDWGKKLCLYQTDALQVDFSQLDYPAKGSVRLIGNLPYNIATTLLFHLLKYRHRIYDFHVMLQKEVVDRLVALPGSKVYGRLSVMMQYYCQMKRLFIVRPGAFFPPPKVESAVVRITPWARLPFPVNDEKLFAEIVKTAFNQRRKTISNSLRSLRIGRERLIQCQIDPQARAEQLSVGDYARLTNDLKD
jgi:16S rRNA (adenine1518-N6/adenine1519-N6)-dimethyltransferase